MRTPHLSGSDFLCASKDAQRSRSPIKNDYQPPIVSAKRRNLPNRILRAYDHAKHLAGLPRSVKDTFAEVCRFVKQHSPFETIFPHKTKIAERIGASERTVYRHLRVLRDAGLIDVLQQERQNLHGQFAVARIRLTTRAAILLDLIAAPEEPSYLSAEETALASGDSIDVEEARMPISSAVDAMPMVDRHHPLLDNSPIHASVQPAIVRERPEDAVENDNPQSAFIHTHDPIVMGKNAPQKQIIHNTPYDKMSYVYNMLTVPTSSKSQPPARTKNGLPEDLAWLSRRGVSRAGVFKLMGLASARGKRLSDIVLVVRQYLRDLTGGRLFAYLGKLATGPTDFAFAAAEERWRQIKAEQEIIARQKISYFRERFKKTTLTNRAGTRLYVIDEQARFAQAFGGAYPVTMPLANPLEWIEGIETGNLVLATWETEQRFFA